MSCSSLHSVFYVLSVEAVDHAAHSGVGALPMESGSWLFSMVVLSSLLFPLYTKAKLW